MAKLRMAHASTHGARKPPGPKKEERLNYGKNNGQATHGARKHTWRKHGAHKPPGPKAEKGRQIFDTAITLNEKRKKKATYIFK